MLITGSGITSIDHKMDQASPYHNSNGKRALHASSSETIDLPEKKPRLGDSELPETEVGLQTLACKEELHASPLPTLDIKEQAESELSSHSTPISISTAHSIFDIPTPKIETQPFIQDYLKFWTIEPGNIRTLASDPDISFSESNLRKGLLSALRIHNLGQASIFYLNDYQPDHGQVVVFDKTITPEFLFVNRRQCIGKGSFGQVFKTVNQNGIVHAIKIAESPKLALATKLEYKKHLSINGFVKTPVLGLMPAPLKHVHLGFTETPTLFAIVNELYSHTLRQEILERPGITPVVPNSRIAALYLERIFIPLTHAVNYLHSKDWVHLDIKSPNVLANPKEQVMLLGDLGSAQSTQLENVDKSKFLFPTNWYRTKSDEIAIQSVFESDKSNIYGWVARNIDIYSLGTLFHEYLTKGQFPFKDKPEPGKAPDPQTSEFRSDLFTQNKVPQVITDLVMQMLDADFINRPPASKVLETLHKVYKESQGSLTQEK